MCIAVTRAFQSVTVVTQVTRVDKLKLLQVGFDDVINGSPKQHGSDINVMEKDLIQKNCTF